MPGEGRGRLLRQCDPRAVNVVEKLSDLNFTKLRSYWFTHTRICGLKNALIARTGYTGEDGFEIYVPCDPKTRSMCG
jgi:aminomethyltransferase